MKFAKYQAAGNDFLLVDGRDNPRDWGRLAVAMCERYTGAGADGLIVAESSQSAPVRMVLFNADGSEAEMSGNGVRCFAKFVIDNEIAHPEADDLAVDTAAGPIIVSLQRQDGVVVGATVDMGPPRFEPAQIPVAVEAPAPVLDLPLSIGDHALKLNCVSMGNPHAVHFLGSGVWDFPLREVGPAVEHHPLFPARVNFEIAQVIDRGHIQSRTWERGVGETQACGTGACAIMASAHLHNLVDDLVEIKEPGGVLTLRWNGAGNIFLTGPAAFVYQGDWPD